jgi:hypothetical protein
VSTSKNKEVNLAHVSGVWKVQIAQCQCPSKGTPGHVITMIVKQKGNWLHAEEACVQTRKQKTKEGLGLFLLSCSNLTQFPKILLIHS